MSEIQLYHTRFGQGEPLIILHGFLGASGHWMTIAKRLSPFFEVILPDLRNHGRSSHSHEFDLNLMVRDVVDLAKDIKLSSFNLLGHSMGGKIAMMLALEFSPLVKKCIVVDISPFSLPEENTHASMLNILNAMDLKTLSSISEAAQLFRIHLQDERMVQLCLKNLKHNDEGGFQWKPNVAVLMEKSDNLRIPLPKEAKFNGDVLFMKGENSAYLKNEEWPEIIKVFPKAQFVEIKHAGHWIHADKPEEFFNTTLQFFRS
jgi:esterase